MALLSLNVFTTQKDFERLFLELDSDHSGEVLLLRALRCNRRRSIHQRWIERIFAEFCVLVQSDSQMEMLVRDFKLERIVASNLKKGSADGPLAAFAEMTEKAVEEAVTASVPLMVACLQSQVKKAKQALSAMHKVASPMPWCC